MTDEKKTEPGVLKSSLTINIHTYYAIRLWNGRKPETGADKSERRRRIIGMPGVISRAGIATKDSENNNPWADEFLFSLEEKLNHSKQKINDLVEQLNDVLRDVPGDICISEISSTSPVNIGVHSRSPLGYKCVWLLVGYDELVLKAFQAFHYGLIARSRRDEILNAGGHAVRQICALAQGYKTIPATRGDISSGSQKGKDAISRYGMPDPDILTGKKRSSFSAPLK
ncbi:TPA: PFL_4669 family integrating conjugative element protein [Escherichia coli]